VDASYTADVNEAVGGPVEVRFFSPSVVLRTGARAEHGTAVACAVAGARAPCGGLPGAEVFCAATGAMEPSALASALHWLSEMNTDVVVLPFGSWSEEEEVERAVRALLDGPRAPVVVASIGNGAPSPGLFPARLTGVLSVAAADDAGALLDPPSPAPVSCILAPGDRILVRIGVSRLREMSGSSVACAIAGGVLLRRLATSRDIS
jgi:hypothetical protein